MKAFNSTDWSDRKFTSLYLDHQDTKERGVGNWVGYVKNIRMQDKGVIAGDLEVWNPLIAIYLSNAKAKFGISATLKGMENKAEGKLESFSNTASFNWFKLRSRGPDKVVVAA